MSGSLRPNDWRGFVHNIGVNIGGLTEQAAVDLMVATATVAKARVLGQRPKPSSYRQIVDSIEGAALTQVRPDGVIVFAWQYLGEVVQETVRLLVQAAPVLTGAYIESIVVFLDGQPVDQASDGTFDLPDLTAQSRITIAATVPYSRRLEVGKRKDGKPFVISAKYRFVEQTALTAQRLFTDLATFKYQHIDLSDGYRLKTREALYRRYMTKQGLVRSNRLRRRLGLVEKDIRYPAIIITPRSA